MTRDDVLSEYMARADSLSAMADRIVELEAAVERVRALHGGKVMYYPNWDGQTVCQQCHKVVPCPTVRALWTCGGDT